LQTLKEGEISDPLQTLHSSRSAYHIVWLRKRTPAHEMNLQDDYRRVEQLALYMKRNKKYEEWLEELKKEIYVDIRANDLR